MDAIAGRTLACLWRRTALPWQRFQEVQLEVMTLRKAQLEAAAVTREAPKLVDVCCSLTSSSPLGLAVGRRW